MVAGVVVAVVAAITTWVVLDDGASDRAAPPGASCAVSVEPAAARDDAPSFRAPGLHGGCIDLAAYRGRPVVVNFWASWCAPCREEFPLFREARRRYRSDGLEFVGVSFRDIDDDAIAFAEDFGARWPLAFDADGAIARAYGVRPIPQSFFLRRDGTIASRVRGITSARELDRELRQIVQ